MYQSSNVVADAPSQLYLVDGLGTVQAPAEYTLSQETSQECKWNNIVFPLVKAEGRKWWFKQ
jgi:hypothetical protein